MTTRNAVAAHDPLLSRKEAAVYLGVEPATLATWASTKRYPLRFLKLGAKLVKYRQSDLDAFVASRAVGGV